MAMAQVELRFFDEEIERETKLHIADASELIVANVHYDQDPRPGMITMVVPILDTDLSQSDASYELEISEDSKNWPCDEAGQLLIGIMAKKALQARAECISRYLAGLYADLSHNIFEVNGQATARTPYKPS